jgi:deoxyribodipyrimidine photo-lyase
VLALRAVTPPDPAKPSALLITEEDCRPEDFNQSGQNILGMATLATSHLRSPLMVSDIVSQFEAGALADTAARLGMNHSALSATDPGALASWARAMGATQIITPYITQGPLFDWIEQARPALAADNITLTEWRRDWDSAIWPHATAGFFKVKQKIPSILDSMIATGG